jgi:hypothetical protein
MQVSIVKTLKCLARKSLLAMAEEKLLGKIPFF